MNSEPFERNDFMKLRQIILAACLIIFGLQYSALHAAAEQWKLPEFMISLWGGPTDDASAQKIVEAGFNTVMVETDKLELCRKHGLKAMLFRCPTELAGKLRGDKSVWGYILVDEPHNKEFPALAKLVAKYRQADPTHPCYVNLDSRGCPRLLVDKVGIPFVSYDYYCWWFNQLNYYNRLEEFSNVARTDGVPLLCWVEVNAGTDAHKDRGKIYVPGNLVKLRHSVYMPLAYGAKGIQWFVDTLLFEGGQLSRCGQDVATVNAELKRLGPFLYGLRSIDAYHSATGTPPATIKKLPYSYWVQTSTPDTVLGSFKDADNCDYIMAVNRNIDKKQTVGLWFWRQIAAVEKFDKKTGNWANVPLCEASKVNTRKDIRYAPGELNGFQGLEIPVAPGNGELLRIR